MKAAIVGLPGPTLGPQEAACLRDAPPAGVMLFARNIVGPEQLARLVADLRALLPDGAVLAVDQEGGRVARLRPPGWRAHPPAGVIGALHALDPRAGLRAAWLQGALIGLDCSAAGFDVSCAPVLDLAVPGADLVIGDRAFSADPDAVGALGRALADGLLAAGVQPVAKHAPGHGRARADSHHELPTVSVDGRSGADLAPFAECADLPWMMTAHILYPGWDPDLPATLSPRVVEGVIRGRIGFKGVLVTDDLAMGALRGGRAALAGQALAAGCDLALHCSGDPDETGALLRACPGRGPAAIRRMDAARALAARRRVPLDGPALAAERARLLACVATA